MSDSGIRIDVRNTIKDVIADISAIQQGIPKKAAVRAVNKAVDGVGTVANREVRKIYNVKARAINAAMKKIKATVRSTRIGGSVQFTGRNIPLIEFDARWTRKMSGASVRIRVGDGRKTVAGSFITTTKGGTTGVYRRTGAARYPIRQLRSVSIPDTIRNEAIRTALEEVGIDRFRNEFVRQMNLLTSKKDG